MDGNNEVVIHAGERQTAGEPGHEDEDIDNVERIDTNDYGDKTLSSKANAIAVMESMERVFSNEMLLEMILNYLIYPNSPSSIDRTDLKKLRLVNKSWLRCVGIIVRKNQDYLFRCVLNKENSVGGTNYCKENGKALNKINSILRNPVGRSKSYQMPTFALRFLPDFFRNENHEDLQEYVEEHGHGLTDLDIFFPLNDSMTMTFRPFYMPKLVRLGVQFNNYRVRESGNASNVGQSGFVPQTTYPLQTILNATSQLSQLQLKFSPSELIIPIGFGFLKLPNTINRLLLDCPLKNEDLNVLLKNDLPKLRVLRLVGTNNPYKVGLIFEILSKFRTSLESLILMSAYYHNGARNATLFRLPIMEKIETMVISPTWELEEDAENPMNWGMCLPNMKNMKLFNQTEGRIIKCVRNSKYESVNRLNVSLINDADDADNHQIRDQPLTIDRQKMQSLHLAFPNVTYLEITVCESLTCGLKYLFWEMKNLQHLSVALNGTRPGQLNSEHWDALLIGVPIDLAASLKKNKDFWSNFSLTDSENYPSIRMLKDLKCLHLKEKFDGSTAPMPSHNEGIENLLISDLSFVFGFLKMPKLDNLLLSGQFKASAAMTERWRNEKGTAIDQRN